MLIIFAITLQLVSVHFDTVCTRVVFDLQQQTDKSRDTNQHIESHGFMHRNFKLSPVALQSSSHKSGINFVSITLALFTVCALMVCFTIRLKLRRTSGKHAAKPDLLNTPPNPTHRPRDVKEEVPGQQMNSSENVKPIVPTPRIPAQSGPILRETCPRSISQFSCGRSELSTERQSSQPNSLCPCTNLDYSTGESGYETIERPTATNTSAETVNEVDRTSFPRKWLRSHSKLDSWVSRATKRFLQAPKSFHTTLGSTTAITTATKQLEVEHLDEGLSFFNHGWKDGDGDELLRDYTNDGLLQMNKAYSVRPFDVCYDGPPSTISRKPFELPFFEPPRIPSQDFEDCVSLVSSDSDMIDPIYSKIRGSMDGLVEDQVDEMFDLESQGDNETTWCEACWGKHYNGSHTSQPISTHPSTHIYYELHRPHNILPPGGHSVEPSTNCSVWSIRPIDRSNQPSLHQFQNGVNKCHSCSSPQSDIPPQLPARLYGQSTVNLVDRLRKLLQPRQSQLVSPTRLNQASIPKKAATMSGILDSPQTDSVLLSPHSLTNMLSTLPDARSSLKIFNIAGITPAELGPQPKNDVKTTQFSSDKDGFWLMPGGCYSTHNQSTVELSGESKKDQHSTISDYRKPKWVPYLRRTRANSSASSTYAIDLVTSEPPECATGASTDRTANIRHIDSEVDLSDAVRSQPLGDELRRTPTLGSSRHIYLPTSTLLSNHKNEFPTNSPSRHYPQPPHTSRHAWSPLDKGPMNNILSHQVTMSPLMERSMEDDETRQLLRLR